MFDRASSLLRAGPLERIVRLQLLGQEFERSFDLVRYIWIHAPSHPALATFDWALHPAFGRGITVAEQTMRVEQMSALLAQLIGTGCLVRDVCHESILSFGA